MKLNTFETYNIDSCSVKEEKLDYLTDKQEIAHYIEKVLKYKGVYTITPMGVEFYNDITISNLPNDTLDIKISKAKYITISNTNLQSLENLPPKCNGLLINNNSFTSLDITTLVSDSYPRLRDNYNLKTISTIDTSLDIRGSLGSKRKIITNRIEFKTNDVINDLRLNSGGITSFDQIIIPSKKIYTLRIDSGCNITSFKEFDFIVYDGCEIFLKTIKNYLYVDKLYVENFSLEIHIYKIVDNIITFLLNKSKIIDFTYLETPKVVADIMHRYIQNPIDKRAEYIMDCAIELIDAGYEKAAEL